MVSCLLCPAFQALLRFQFSFFSHSTLQVSLSSLLEILAAFKIRIVCLIITSWALVLGSQLDCQHPGYPFYSGDYRIPCT